MKRRRPSIDTKARPPSPWRWAIGGPITDFGDDGIEAGPSCAPFTVPETDDGYMTLATCSECCESDRVHAVAAPKRSRSAAITRQHLPSPVSSWDTSQQHLFSSSDPPLLRHLHHAPPPSPTHSLSHTPLSPPPTRRRLRTRHALTAALAVAAAFSPLAAAGPLPSATPTPSTQHPPRALGAAPIATPAPTPHQRRLLEVDPEYSNPTSLPSVSTVYLPETVLPYYLTQSSDGSWYKVENAWWMYGRVIDTNTPGPSQTNQPSATASGTEPTGPSYAVISVLPRGWGVPDTRSAFYRTPLIVTASVILALIIVAGIIFITIQRRKAARRRKRHEARMRRKALAAAGLTEDQVLSGPEAERFKERLAEFERQYLLKKRRPRSKQHQSTFVRTKVRVWHKGLRKRKGGGDRELEDEKPETNGFSSSHVLSGRNRGSPAASSFTASHTSLATSRSSGSFDIDDAPRTGLERAASVEPETREAAEDGSDQTPETLVNSDSPSSPTSSNPQLSVQPQDSSQTDTSSTSEQQSSGPAAASGSAPQYTNFPPAYRPASVHTASGGEASGSSQPSSSGMRNVAITSEKVAASGFYPAPATVEAEQAQSIAHRADAKAPIVPPPEDEEQRAQHHVATDDKRELERLRLGGSAPPVAREDGDDAGPSAPRFEVDESGFEMIPEELSEPIDSPTSPVTSTPGIPAPPAPARMKSLLGFGSLEPLSETFVGSAPPTMSSDTLSLQPSAPPLDFDHDDDDAPSAPSAPAPQHIPSAPPTDEAEDDMPHESSSPLTAATSGAPSAPPLDDFDDDDDDASSSEPRSEDHPEPTAVVSASRADCAAADEDPDVADMRANLGVNGHRFLPRYEP